MTETNQEYQNQRTEVVNRLSELLEDDQLLITLEASDKQDDPLEFLHRKLHQITSPKTKPETNGHSETGVKVVEQIIKLPSGSKQRGNYEETDRMLGYCVRRMRGNVEEFCGIDGAWCRSLEAVYQAFKTAESAEIYAERQRELEQQKKLGIDQIRHAWIQVIIGRSEPQEGKKLQRVLTDEQQTALYAVATAARQTNVKLKDGKMVNTIQDAVAYILEQIARQL